MFGWWRRTTSENGNGAFTFSGAETTEEADAARTWKGSHVDQAHLRAALTFSQSNDPADLDRGVNTSPHCPLSLLDLLLWHSPD